MKGEISQPLKALELWRGEFASSEFSALNSYFSLPISLSIFPPFALKTMVVFIEKQGCQRVNEEWKGLIVFPPPIATRTCQPCLVSLRWKKDKKNAESGSGTQCRLALCFKILELASIRIKNWSASLKIKVLASTVLKN